MINELKGYENLGDPDYFFELFSSLKAEEGTWSVMDAEQLFYNKNINGNSIFDGCIALAIKVSILTINEDGLLIFNNNFRGCLVNKSQMCEKFVEFLFHSLKHDENFHSIFSTDYISYDIIHHTAQLHKSAFKFKYSNFKQLLIDFNVIQIHPVNEISKYLLNSQFKNIYDTIILPEIKKRQIGIDELKKTLEQQAEYGEEAEKFVLNFEKARLENKLGIDWVAEYSVAEGYDISSFQKKESRFNDCFIEVKSFSGSPYFFWSRNEIDISRIKGDQYFLYLVDRNQIAKIGYRPFIIQNPFHAVLNNPNWFKQVEKYKFGLEPNSTPWLDI